ncbi:MAG: histidine kinase [Aggregatilineales bacterium]
MTTHTKDTLISELRAEREQIAKRLREIQSMIDQSQAEFRRLQQRSAEVTTQMKRIEENFDTVPRNDIKVVYNSALDTRTRLLTSQAQLEKLQQDRAQLEYFGNLLNNALNRLEGVALPDLPLSTGQQSAGETGLSNETIIRLVQSQESERQRLARQMHDGPAQSLTNFILQAEICRRLFDRDPSRATEELENLKTAASTTFQRVRDFIFELRPMMLDDLGLVPTMRRYVDVFMDKSGIETRINVVGEERRLEPHTEVTFFRSLQELLGYARDNARSSKIDIVLDIAGNPAKASVTFNGLTITEIEEAVEQNKHKMFGLARLAERIELVGGQIEFQSIEGEPNRVEIALPTNIS